MKNPFVSQVVLYAFNFAPRGWSLCDGTLMTPSQNYALFAILGTRFGGQDVSSFALPDYRGAAPAGLTYCIALEGAFPARDSMQGDPVVGEISLLPTNFVLAENVECNGQLLELWTYGPYQRLFSVVGTRFGGDGTKNFGVPNLKALAPQGSAYYIATKGPMPKLVEPFIGEVRIFPGMDVPNDWLPCSGQTLPIRGHQELYSLIGDRFGGDQTQFTLPNLKQLAPAGTQFCIASAGAYPQRA
ncbi:MAG: tail fiber protein [Gemmatimonadota bacterium]